MTVPINTSLTPRLRPQQGPADPATEASGRMQPVRPTEASASADGVTLSEAATTQMGAKLADQGPPFDLEQVAKIKQAIAEGRYPIDTRAISESLFSGYTDMLL